MLQQNETLRTKGTRRLPRPRLRDAHRRGDAALARRRAEHLKGPNENLSREFMEIFTLGHGDGYTETRRPRGRPGAHRLEDRPPDGGGRASAAGLHDDRAEDASSAAPATSAPRASATPCSRGPARPRYLATRLWSRFVSDAAPPPAVLDRARRRRTARTAISARCSRPCSPTRRSPRPRARFVDRAGRVADRRRPRRCRSRSTDGRGRSRQLAGTLDSLGQLPFYPPSVGGWPAGRCGSRPRRRTCACAPRRCWPSAARPRRRCTGSTHGQLDALAHLLGIEAWSARSLAVLKGAAGPTRTSSSPIALNTPEYLVH